MAVTATPRLLQCHTINDMVKCHKISPLIVKVVLILHTGCHTDTHTADYGGSRPTGNLDGHELGLE